MTTTIRFALLSVAATGCSIIYNPDKIPTQSDAPIDAVIDANPSMLSLSDFGPPQIFEGQGDNGSRPSILVIHGSNFITGVHVDLTATASVKLDVDNSKLQISGGHDYLAVPVTAHVDTNITDGMSIPLTIAVSQPVDGQMVSKTLDGPMLMGLDELDAPLADWKLLKQRYSTVNLSTDAILTAGAPQSAVRIWASSSISVANVKALGNPGSGTSGGAAVAGGCAGGTGGIDGKCPGHGTGAPIGLLANAGGGGGGLGGQGADGTGGSGGDPQGDDTLATFDVDKGPGGGGGSAALNSAGGGGGAGGGCVLLYADGDLTVGTAATNATVDVSGGAGASGGGGGGGGAGGAIVVHAGGSLVVHGSLTSNGGGKGGTNAGAGGVGRIRWDAPASAAPSATPLASQGLSFGAATPFVVDSKSATLPVVGTLGHSFDISTTDQSSATHSGSTTQIVAGGTAEAPIPWQPGYNRICIKVAGVSTLNLEVGTCVDVAYLP